MNDIKVNKNQYKYKNYLKLLDIKIECKNIKETEIDIWCNKKAIYIIQFL